MDLIERQAAIDAIRASTSKYTGFMEMEMYTDDDAVEAINGVPSAQPEQKKGMWVKATGMMPPEYHGRYCCSECGNFANMEPPFGNREDLSNYCPNCGADMRGEEDG